MKLALALPPASRISDSEALIRASFATMRAHLENREPLEFLRRDDARAIAIITKTDQTAGSTTGSGWSAELISNSYGAFLEELEPYSGAARILAEAIRADLPRGTAYFPARTAAPTVPQWVAELDEIPVVSSNFANVALGPARKMAHMVVFSRELAKRSDAFSIFRTMLLEDAAAGLDAGMFASSAGSSSALAGLLNGVTETSVTGTAGNEIKDSLTALGEAVAAGGSGRIVYVMAPERVARLRVLAPELASSLDLAASGAVAGDRVIAVDPLGIIAAIGAPEIDISNQAIVHMSDVPLEIVSGTGPTTADPVRSMWQTGSLALRVISEMAWAKRRTAAAAYATVTW